MRSTYFLLALPLLSSARDPNPDPTEPKTVTIATTILTPTTTSDPSSTSIPKSNHPSTSTITSNSSTTSPTTHSPNPLTPPQRQANFNKDYHSLLSAQTNNTLWAALAIGNIPRASALAQERAYIDRLSTATGEVPQPAYITGLPADQKAYVQSFNRQVASIAKVDFFGEARNATNATNATSVSTMGGRQGATTTAGQTSQGPSSSASASASASATNTTGSKALGNPSQPTGIYKMAGAAVVGVLGVAAFL